MSDFQERTLNVEVSQVGKDQFGNKKLAPEEVGVAFRGIDGFWVPTRGKAGTPDLQGTYRGTGKWPKQVGTVFLATLRARPTGEPGKWYHDIVAIGPPAGEPESWSYEGSAAPSGGGSRAASGSEAAAAFTGGLAVSAKDRSIERQVVVKAMAELLAASIHLIAAGSELAGLSRLAVDFESRCDELWFGESASVAADRAADAADAGAGPDDHGDSGEQEPTPPGELADEDIPF